MVGRGAALGADAVDQLCAAELAVLGRAFGTYAVDQLCAADAAVRTLGRGLLRCVLLPGLLPQLRHIRGEEHIRAARAGLVGQLSVDGDHVFQQQDDHHHQLIAEPDQDRPEEDEQQARAAGPVCAAPVAVFHVKQQEHAVEYNEGRGENVKPLEDLLHQQEFEGAGVVEEFAESAQLFPALFGDDEDKGQHCGCDGQYQSDGNKDDILHSQKRSSLLYTPV